MLRHHIFMANDVFQYRFHCSVLMVTLTVTRVCCAPDPTIFLLIAAKPVPPGLTTILPRVRARETAAMVAPAVPFCRAVP